MTPRRSHRTLRGLGTLRALRVYPIVLVAGLSVSVLVAQTVLGKYGVSETHAKQIVMSAVQGMYSLGDAAKPFLKLVPSARGAVVNEVVGWAKTYLASPEFKAAWTTERNNAKPTGPDQAGTVDDEVKKEMASQMQQAAEMRKMLPMLPASDRATIEAQIKAMEDRTKDPAAIAVVKQTITARRADEQQTYQDDLKKWQDEYPADPNVMIAKHLHEFLTVSGDVNFDAKTVARDGRTVFTDEQFEQKSSFWKMCFRAGREANVAARAAATQWLKEIGR